MIALLCAVSADVRQMRRMSDVVMALSAVRENIREAAVRALVRMTVEFIFDLALLSRAFHCLTRRRSSSQERDRNELLVPDDYICIAFEAFCCTFYI